MIIAKQEGNISIKINDTRLEQISSLNYLTVILQNNETEEA